MCRYRAPVASIDRRSSKREYERALDASLKGFTRSMNELDRVTLTIGHPDPQQVPRWLWA